MTKSINVLAFIAVLAMIASGFAVMTSAEIASKSAAKHSSAIIYVPDDYAKIQWAADNASVGDTIIVRDGTYTENVVVNVNNLAIQTQNGSSSTIVQAADPCHYVFEITADSVKISGFTVTNTSPRTGSYPAGGIYLNNADCCIISNNNASNYFHGIHLFRSSNNTLINNAVSKGIYGIALSYSSNNILSNNTASAFKGGITLSYSSNNILTKNTANSNRLSGIALSYSNNNTLMSNTANLNTGLAPAGSSPAGPSIWFETGISLRSSNNNMLVNNTANSNKLVGFKLIDSSNNTFTSNIAKSNKYGIYIYCSSNNKIYLNNFINRGPFFSNSTHNAYSTNSSNIWDSPGEITYIYKGKTYERYMGNYWDDYREYDLDRDGIGKIPYHIDADTDNYPLIEPWENYFAPAPSVFGTGTGTYPRLMGTHKGTITPSSNINVSKLYTYPCAGTGGHTESIKLYENGTVIANGTWYGYHEDWHNITLNNVTDGTHYVTLLQDHEYNYTIRTGSYPQILHAASKEVTGGTITCTSFVDTNGKTYTDWIPAIKFF